MSLKSLGMTVVVAIAMFVLFVVFGSNRVDAQVISEQSMVANVEVILDWIAAYGRNPVTFSVPGTYFDKAAKTSDGNVRVDQNGKLFIQTMKFDKNEEHVVYGSAKEFGNVLKSRDKKMEYIITGLYSIDLNQDGFHDIIVRVVTIFRESGGLTYSQPKMDFYFAKGNGEFAKGKSKVSF